MYFMSRAGTPYSVPVSLEAARNLYLGVLIRTSGGMSHRQGGYPGHQYQAAHGNSNSRTERESRSFGARGSSLTTRNLELQRQCNLREKRQDRFTSRAQ